MRAIDACWVDVDHTPFVASHCTSRMLSVLIQWPPLPNYKWYSANHLLPPGGFTYLNIWCCHHALLTKEIQKVKNVSIAAFHRWLNIPTSASVYNGRLDQYIVSTIWWISFTYWETRLKPSWSLENHSVVTSRRTWHTARPWRLEREINESSLLRRRSRDQSVYLFLEWCLNGRALWWIAQYDDVCLSYRGEW